MERAIVILRGAVMRRKLQTAADRITAIFLALVVLFVVLYFVDTERKTVWIPFDGWSKKETK
jgi:hypothetical protein